MAVNRRSRVQLYFEVLELLYQEGTATGRACLCSVARKAKIPYVRFQKIVAKLIASKLILQTSTGVLMTADGLYHLQRMRQASKFLNEMGLSI